MKYKDLKGKEKKPKLRYLQSVYRKSKRINSYYKTNKDFQPGFLR